MAERIWREIVYAYVRTLAKPGGHFNIRDFDQFFDAMRQEKPENPFIAEKIRQQFQILRDRGLVEFLTRGSYRRLK